MITFDWVEDRIGRELTELEKRAIDYVNLDGGQIEGIKRLIESSHHFGYISGEHDHK